MTLDYAGTVNSEMRDLFAAWTGIVRVDEPCMQARPKKTRAFGLKAVNRALEGIEGRTALHLCFGYAAVIHHRPKAIPSCRNCRGAASNRFPSERRNRRWTRRCWKACPATIILGVLDLSDMTVESPEMVAARIRRALPHVAPERVIVAPDCGLRYLPRNVAYGKMEAVAKGAAIVRAEMGRS